MKIKRKIRCVHMEPETEQILEKLWVEAVNKGIKVSKNTLINKAVQSYKIKDK